MIVHNHQIKFIACYFGDMPPYFKYFLRSCSENPEVSFLLFTDNRATEFLIPKNVSLIYMDLKSFSVLASSKLNMEINITRPYKLCDFKPAYGLIFEDYLSGCDYWGHCDIDIIFGDIKKFISEPISNDYDIISVRHDYLSGFFLIYKNSSYVNHLFSESKDYQYVFLTPYNCCFDETNHRHLLFTSAFDEGISPEDVNTKIDCMTQVVARNTRQGLIKSYFDFHVIEGIPGKLLWENGKLYFNKEFEVLLYHMIHFKKICRLSNSSNTVGDRFQVTKKTILE